MKAMGRLLQIAALLLLPVGIVLELGGAMGRHPVADLLILMIFGLALFYVGRMVEGYSRS